VSAQAADPGVIYSDNTWWVELQIPYVKFEGTDTAPGTERVGEVGVSGGWAPFADDTSDADDAFVKLLKNLQYTLSLNAHKKANFDQYVGSFEVPVNSYSTCEDSYGNFEYWRCRPCRDVSSNTGYCRMENVYARDTVISYVDDSIQLGVMVPFNIGDHFSFSVGPEMNILFIREGRVTNQLKRKEEVGANVAARVEWDFGESWLGWDTAWGISATVRKTVAGPKADMAHFGA